MKKSTFNQMTNPSCSERDWNGGTSRVSRGNAILYSFLPRTLLVLITLLTLGVGQMWADYGLYGCWFSYSYSGTTGNNNDYNTDDDKNKSLGTLSEDLVITAVYLKAWDNDGGNRTLTNGQLCYTTNNWGSTSYVGANDWSLGTKGGNNYQLEKSSTSWTLARTTDASGNYTLKYYWQAWGGSDRYLNDGGSNYSFTYTVDPPAVSGFTITPSGEGYVSGSGTEGDPYIIHHSSGNLTLTISGSQAHTDANSVAEYSVDGGSTWSTSVDYVTINRSFAATTAKSKTLKMRYKNSTASLTGTESSFTAYYKKEAGYTITKWGNTTGGSYTVPSSAGAVSGGTVSASPSTGYNFGSWSVTSGSGTWENSTSTASNKFYPTSNSTLKATFTAKNYTVTLDKNDGDSNGSIRTTYNSTSTSSFTGASRVGYSCDGYFTASDGGTKIINADGTLVNETVSGWLSSGKWVKNAATITLYAHWTENATNYTLHYTYGTGLSSLFSSISAVNSSDASAISDNASLVSGTGVTLTATPATHYRFDGWYSAAGCAANTLVSTDNPYSFSISANTNLYAKAELMTTTITLNANGGAGGTSSVTATHGSRDLSSSITKPTRTGYTLGGWYTAESGGTKVINSTGYTAGSVSGYTDASDNWTYTESTLTLYAQWTEQKKTLTPTVDYNGGATPSPAYTATSANTVGVATTTVLTASEPNAEHYTFAGWTLTNLTVTNGNPASDRSITVKITDYSQAISAVAEYEEVLTSRWHLVGNSSDFPDGWNVNSTTMMQKKTGHSTESVVYFTVDVNSTDTKEFKIVDDNGASDDIWYGYSSGDTYLTWTATATNNVYAKDDGGTDHNKNNLKYTPTVTGPYEFKVDYSGTYPAVTITYPTSYTVTYSVSPAGAAGAITTSPSFSSGDLVLSGTSVTFTHASANSGYTWYRWENGSGSSLGTGSTYNTSISANTTVVAKYTENNYTVTVAAGAGGSVASTSVTGHVSTKVTLPTATPSTGYYFTGWEVTSGTATLTSASSANAAQINGMTDDVTVRANFAPIWYLKGDFNSWGEGNPIALASSTSGSVTLTTTSAKLSNSKFKIWNKQTDTYYQKASQSITRAANTASGGWTSGGTSNDMKFNSDVIGDYIFAVTFSSNIPSALTVTYPTAYTVTFGKGTGGSTITASATSAGGSFTSGSYVVSGDDVTFTQAAAAGYTFKGWYTTADGNTTVTGMSTSDHVLDDINANATVYAQYTENLTAITITTDGHGTITAPSPNSSPYNLGVATTLAINATANAGYTWSTWTKSGNAALGAAATTASNTAKGNGTAGGSGTITATFTPNNYTITLNNHEATSAGTTSVSVTFDATTNLTSNITCPSKTGYTFGGYYTEEGGSGTQIINASGAWQTGNAWINAGGNWVNVGDVTLHAKWTANTYTVTFNANGGTCATASKTVTFASAYGTLPVATPPGEDSFIGWYTTATDDPVVGTHVTEETIVSTAAAHTLYARYETTFEIVVQFKSGGAAIYPGTKVNASASSLSPTIIAPEIFGYSFSGWTETTTSYVTFANASKDTTTITATGAATIVANYNVVPTVYFKNNLGWDSVFVSFNCSFVEGKGYAPSNNGKPYFAMTQIGTTDVYYCEIPSTYTDGNYADWAWNIAFDNTNYGKTATTTHSGTWSEFYGGECVGRGDFDPKATLFIPFNGDTEDRNTCTFYKTGCWMKYNSTESGYQLNMNEWVTGEHDDMATPDLIAPTAGGYEFSATVNLSNADYSYGFKLYKKYQKNTTDLWFTNLGAIYASTEDLPWEFVSGTSVTATSQRCELHTEAVGDYKITVSFATGKPMVDVEYPTSVGDWRLAYNDRIAWSGDAHGEEWYLYSRVIKAKANAEDTVSFYVSKAEGANAHVELQKCTAIDPSTAAETWTKQGDNLDLSDISGTGIYNFKVTQNGSKVASAAVLGGYEGNFYIRTDASDGGWINYKTLGKNEMTYSEYAKDNSGFTHYFMRFVNAGTNIKFCIANDYSPCLTEYCIDDDYTGEYIAVYGNVRFMWDHRSNAVSRAYISGSSNVSDRFLVLEGDAKMFDEAGNALIDSHQVSGLEENEMKFTDDQNWIYEATVQAQPGARIKLTAKYNNKIQYFYGDEGSTAADSVLLIGGSGTEKYKVRVVYDFKTNRLLKAFIPNGDITVNLPIETDLMIIRDHQADAQQITFNGGSLSAVKTVYGAMKFNKWTVNDKLRTEGHGNAGLNRYERDLFYISFPFEVKLNEAFGFGTYGKHWIIEYYDGKGRAEKGFWKDSDPNWKFVTPAQRNNGFTMKAFEGYILALDLDELTESSDVWNNGVEDVYIYFPSTDSLKNIEATNRLVTIDQEGYECTINRPTADGDRRVKDSYWHCIGVPSFANYNRELSPTEGGSTIGWNDANSDSDNDQWTTPNLPYLYEWVSSNNLLRVTSSATFAFKATWSYLVQYAGPSIYWSSVNVTPSSVVARRANKEAPTNAEFCIELQQEGNKADQTFVRLTNDENVTTGFDFNYDLSKEFNKNKANIYTMVSTNIDGDLSTTETAGNCLPMSEQTTIVPMGIQIAKAGEYTISIPSGTNGVGVTLIDNETGLRTNLALEDYRVELDAATYNSRFIIEISPIVSVLTGVEQTAVSGQPSDVRKVIIDQKMYIIKDGKVYDAQGARVR